MIDDEAQDDGVLERQPETDDEQRRQRAPHRCHEPVMRGQRMQMSDTARAAHEGQRPRLAYPECADREQCEREGQCRRSHVFIEFSSTSGGVAPVPGATLFNAALLQLRETELRT